MPRHGGRNPEGIGGDVSNVSQTPTKLIQVRGWTLDGTWERVHDTLRPNVREAEGRSPTPSAAIIDSQSVKMTEKGGLVAMMLVRR